MKRLLLLVLSLLLAFYVGWPIWSAYRIHAALEANDAQMLEVKVDFPKVRASLRPTVTAEVERVFDRGGAVGQILGGALKQQLAPQLVDTILNGVVTPHRIGELYQRRGDIKEFLAERAARREAHEAGGQQPAGIHLPGGITLPRLGRGGAATGDRAGKAEEKAPEAEPPAATPAGRLREKPTLANIKHFAITGPVAFELGVARDKAASTPDVVAHIGFTDFDWKLVGLVPRAR